MRKPLDQKAAGKIRAQRRGRWAEHLTALVLRLTGHRILAHNFKTQVGEIDLIAQRANTVCFIEVKARATQAQAAEAVSVNQRRRVQRAAEWFLAHNAALQTCEVRFDVALVTGPLRVTIVRDAWQSA